MKMGETLKTGKAVLRDVGNRMPAGLCAYSRTPSGLEISLSSERIEPGMAAVAQLGPDRGYACLKPSDATQTMRSVESGIRAVWVTDGARPVLFAQIGGGPFDAAAARAYLPGTAGTPPPARPDLTAQPERAAPPAAQLQEPAMLPEPSPLPEMPAQADMRTQAEAAGNWQPAAEPEQTADPSLCEQANPPPVIELPPPYGAAPPAAEAVPARPPAQAAEARPLVIRRAPRPGPRPPVYSPLWDDVSAEFEKMLDSLPAAHPFDGSAGDARFAELPMAGAVQCYIGSVSIGGVKVFLQAVPSRPFARPAGFDRTLVNRNGECFWVKYFIQE